MRTNMSSTSSKQAAAEIAELTFQLLANCQEKEERIAQQLNINVSEFRCLRAFRDDQSLSIKSLMGRINLSGSRLTRILAGLEKKGFAQRRLDIHDRRSITVHLSKKGIELAKKLEERYIEIHQEILSGIPKKVHAPLISGMHNMLASLRTWLSET